jgi:plasmid stabilization system protein ParE
VKPDRFDEAALAEYAAAVRWYFERDPAVAHRFREHVLGTIATICESPALSPPVRGVPKRLGVRRRVIARFPYSIVYVELEDEVLILAVAHSRRRPSYWHKRLPPE